MIHNNVLYKKIKSITINNSFTIMHLFGVEKSSIQFFLFFLL